MEPAYQHSLTTEEREANIANLIARWKRQKQQSEEETRSRIKTPEYQAVLNDLRERNAAKGIIIPEK